jgi:hypothetical protein
VSTCTHAATYQDTINGASATTPGFTPASGDLLVVLAAKSQSSADDSPQITNSDGVTFTQIRQEEHTAAQQHRLAVFVADALSDPISQTVTYNTTIDNANGHFIYVCRVSLMTRTGASAVRQHAGLSDASASPPETTFAANCLTGNPVFTVICAADAPMTTAVPTDFTSFENQDYLVPTQGMQYGVVNSGYTIDTVTWASDPVSTYTMISLELDTSAGGGGGGPGPAVNVDTRRFPKTKLRRRV